MISKQLLPTDWVGSFKECIKNSIASTNCSIIKLSKKYFVSNYWIRRLSFMFSLKRVKGVRIWSYSAPHFSRIFPHLDWILIFRHSDWIRIFRHKGLFPPHFCGFILLIDISDVLRTFIFGKFGTNLHKLI